ncbi:hypothetical protein L7F22_046578 [Adiantum nelumboides]|nr:hypothetical protein [Adiantum nelumboides]
MGEPSSSWQNFNFRDDEGSAQGMQALRLLLAKLQEAQANPRLKPSVNNLLMTEDLMLTSTQRLPSSVAPMHLEGGEGVPVMHGPMQANVVPHPLQGPLQTDGAKKKQYHGQERHVGKIREEGDFHDDDDEPPSRSRHKKRTNERRTKRSRRNSSGGSSSSSQSGHSSHGRFPKKGGIIAARLTCSDSNWAGCFDTRVSTSGFCFMLGSSCISWLSKKQPTVATSSCEAECMAVFTTTVECVWLRRLMADLGVGQDTANTIYTDNQSALAVARNPVIHARTKHIEVHYHYVRERLSAREISLAYVPTQDNLVDLFYKGIVS